MFKQKNKEFVENTLGTWMRILIYCQVIYLLVFDGFFLSFPILSKVHYLTDVVTLMLLLGIILDWKRLFRLHGYIYYIPMFAYIFVCIVTAIINRVDPFLFIWASRNTFRFFIFFFACMLYLRPSDITDFFDKLLKLQFINFPLAIIEYLYFSSLPYGTLDILQDHVSGIFGIETGGNGCLNIYLCLIVIACIVNMYEKGKIGFVHIFTISTSMLCAAISELKVFFPEVVGIFIIINILYFKKILTQPSLFVKISILIIVCFALGMVVMLQLYPYASKVYENYGSYEKKSSVTYQLGRVGAFSKINDLFFRDSVMGRLIGLGFGNCEYSSISLFTSDFYREYYFYHYRWFTHQMIYLETGLLGFITFSMFIISIALQSFVTFLKDKNSRKIAVISISFSAILFVNLWYNCIIRSDFGYICYFFLSAVPVLINGKKELGCSE